MLELARALFHTYGYRLYAIKFLLFHEEALEILGEKEVEEFRAGINDWGATDGFARGCAGPAWVRGRISDMLVHTPARSTARWWWRAAPVSTVALNVRACGGAGGTKRALSIWKLLVDDKDDMVVKGMSWAL